MEAVYLALAAEAAGGGEGEDGTSSSTLPHRISGKKRARVDDAGAVIGASDEDDAAIDGDEMSDDNRNGSGSGSGGPTLARARSLLHATISRYFDEGSNDQSNTACGGASASGGRVSGGGDAAGDIDPSPMALEREEAATSGGSTVTAAAGTAMEDKDEAGKTERRAMALPHQPLDKRACEVLVRDASVLVTDPSFQGRLDAGFDDGFGGGGSGGGLGFFDVATGATAAAGGGGGTGARGMAPHSWLLKVNGDAVAVAWRGVAGGGLVARVRRSTSACCCIEQRAEPEVGFRCSWTCCCREISLLI